MIVMTLYLLDHKKSLCDGCDIFCSERAIIEAWPKLKEKLKKWQYGSAETESGAEHKDGWV